MSNPWDPFPQPTKGDDSDRITYEWAGRVISQWEHIEFQLGLLYTIFAGKAYWAATIKEYGVGRIFRDRLQVLRSRANQYFIKNSHQDLEATFDAICIAVEGFADRRNEVAHAIVFPTLFLPSFKEDRLTGRDRWALTPPFFTVRNFDDAGFPKYAYTSHELNQLVLRLQSLHKRIEDFQEALLKASGLPPKRF